MSIQDGAIVRLDYNDQGGRKGPVAVLPVGLAFDRGEWFLLGVAINEGGEEQRFRLAGIHWNEQEQQQ